VNEVFSGLDSWPVVRFAGYPVKPYNRLSGPPVNRLTSCFVSLQTGKPANRRTGKPANRLNSTGFTLIELMLVVIIIGVLSAMVVPKLAGRSEQARIQAAKTDINSNLALALDLYEMDMGSYPDVLNSLVASPGSADNWRGPYVKKKPLDPWNREYLYKFPGEHNAENYDLYSSGKDGQAGTEDDIKNWE